MFKVKKTVLFFLLPSMILLFVFKIYPIVYSIFGSFFEIRGTIERTFTGLTNYINLFSDPEFWNASWVTLKFTFIATIVQIILAIGLALLLNKKVKGVRAFRSIVFLPITIAMVVTTVIWRLLYDPNSGLFNSFLVFLGFDVQPFLTSASQALLCIILMCCWNWTSYWSMFLLAGLQAISPDVVEAAEIDSASPMQRFFRITLPLLKRSIAFVTISNTISNALLFSPMYMLTKGGPSGSTKVLMLEAYQSMFVASDLGRSYSIVTLIIIVLLVIVGLQSKFLKASH